MFFDLIPDPRPSKAHPEHRAKRKAIEKENPHFSTQEIYLKGGVLALMAGIALYPWEKKYEEHVKEHHPERLEQGKKDKEKKSERRREGEGEGDRDGRDRRRSESDRSRRRSVSDVYMERRPGDWELVDRRRRSGDWEEIVDRRRSVDYRRRR